MLTIRRYSTLALWFLGGALLVGIVAWALGILPSYVQDCHYDQANHKDCAVYNLASFLFWKITEALNGVSLALTALATVAVAYFTGTIWSINRSQLAHSHQIERAYISGGGVLETRLVPKIQGNIAGGMLIQVPEPTGNFQVHINNYGKTTGELLEIAVDFCDASNIPERPRYARRPLHTWIAPGEKGVPIDTPSVPTDRPATAIYGRFYYRDIFGRRWSCGFIQSINTQTGETAHIRASAGYTGDREDSEDS